jgi:hypothetical protein
MKSGETKSGTTGASDSKSGAANGGKAGASGTSGQGTAGQGAAGGATATLSQEQRTQVVQKFKTTDLKRAPADQVNFNITVGSTVPATVTYYEVPASIIEVVPAWRGYRYIVVKDEILIIDPSTRRIVAVLDV